jgi:hypothetical protein
VEKPFGVKAQSKQILHRSRRSTSY